jgi:hypothetical protein
MHPISVEGPIPSCSDSCAYDGKFVASDIRDKSRSAVENAMNEVDVITSTNDCDRGRLRYVTALGTNIKAMN